MPLLWCLVGGLGVGVWIVSTSSPQKLSSEREQENGELKDIEARELGIS